MEAAVPLAKQDWQRAADTAGERRATWAMVMAFIVWELNELSPWSALIITKGNKTHVLHTQETNA